MGNSAQGIVVVKRRARNGQDGANGKDGKDGTNGTNGKNGIGVKSANVLFAVHAYKNDSSGIADSAWKDTFSQLTLQSGYYVWSCTKTVYTEGNPTYTGKHCLGACYDFAEVTEMYVLTDSGSTIPDDGAGWSTGYTAVKGKYLWSCSRVVYTNSDIKYINKTCVGYFAKDGTNGTSFTPRGTALGHYANYAAYKADGGNGKDDDIFLVDTMADKESGMAYPCTISFDSGGNECYDKADVGDAYRIGTSLWVNNGSLWVDFGDIQGPKGDTGESALRVEISPKQIVLSVDEDGNLIIDDGGEHYLPSDYETVDLIVYKGQTNVTKKATLALSTPSGCNFSNENETNLKYSSYQTGKHTISICPLGIETTTYTVGDEKKTLPKAASFVRATVTYGSETAMVDIPLFVEFTAYNGGLKSDIYGLDASYTSLESKVTEQGTTLTEHTTQIASNSKKISLNASEVDRINGGLTASGIDITAGEITIDSGTVKVKNGSTTAALFENGKIKTDYVDAETVVADGIKAGNIDAEGATIENLNVTNVSVVGTMRSKYAVVENGGELSLVDNVNLDDGNGWFNKFSLSWTSEMIGRTIRISNYTESSASIMSPSGKYFNIDAGEYRSLHIMPYSCVILHGYGVGDTFKYWIVENRYKYTVSKTIEPIGSSPMPLLSRGYVLVYYDSSNSEWDFDINQNTPSGTITAERLGCGKYRLYLPTLWSDYLNMDTRSMWQKLFVMVTGCDTVYVGTSQDAESPCKATVKGMGWTSTLKYQAYIDIWTSDNESVNDGSFSYMIGLMDYDDAISK